MLFLQRVSRISGWCSLCTKNTVLPNIQHSQCVCVCVCFRHIKSVGKRYIRALQRLAFQSHGSGLLRNCAVLRASALHLTSGRLFEGPLPCWRCHLRPVAHLMLQRKQNKKTGNLGREVVIYCHGLDTKIICARRCSLLCARCERAWRLLLMGNAASIFSPSRAPSLPARPQGRTHTYRDRGTGLGLAPTYIGLTTLYPFLPQLDSFSP